MTKLRALQRFVNCSLPNNWKLVPLSKLIDLVYGDGLSDEKREVGDIPVFGSNGIVGYHNNSTVKGPAIIVGRKGSAGEVTWSDKDCFPIDTTFYVKLIEDIDLRWLYYVLIYVDFMRLNAATGVPGLSRRDALDIYVPYPDKNEQELIAKVVGQVDNVIANTRTVIDKSECLKKSLMQNLLSGRLMPDGTQRNTDEFYLDDRFGKVPKQWSVFAVADPAIVDLDPNYEYTKDQEYPFVPMDAVDEGFQGIREVEYRKIDGGGYSRFRSGDIIYAKITPCVENGKVALVEDIDGGLGFGSTEFIVLSPKPAIDKSYLYYQVISGNVHRLAISLMEGTTARQRIPAKIFRKRAF